MRTIFIILFVFNTLCIHGQEYKPTSSWPYIYPEFSDGVIISKSGERTHIPVNIHLMRNQLHYLDQDNVKQLDLAPVAHVEVNGGTYMNVENQLIRLLKAKESGFLGIIEKGDFGVLVESGGAYGVSSNTQSTQKGTSIDIGGADGSMIAMNHMLLREEKEKGKIIPVSQKYYLVVNHKLYPATKKGIEKELSPHQQAEFKKFVKTNKIKWKEENSLFKVLDFFKEI